MRTLRKYGKPIRKTRAELLFAELPQSPLKKTETLPEPVLKVKLELEPESETRSGSEPEPAVEDDAIKQIAKQLEAIEISDSGDENETESEKGNINSSPSVTRGSATPPTPGQPESPIKPPVSHPLTPPHTETLQNNEYDQEAEASVEEDESFRILTWDDVCPPGDTIQKIAEASYAEVYRISNERGTSIIKVIRLQSPIKPQTKPQQRSGLVDEEPHSEESLSGELQISEWLADVPGFVVYKERYVVQGKAPKALLETHQAFHRRMKRQDPDRLQFYPSPSRYLDETRFMVVELGDAGTALEDFVLDDIDQVWDIFLHTAIALARAEELVQFEHRDLHEGNLCIRRAKPAHPRSPSSNNTPRKFGYSGLEITILDYGLSRASDPDFEPPSPSPTSTSPSSPTTIFHDLETDLSLFTSTHAPQCAVYRQMRSYLLSGHTRGGRKDPFLNPEAHHTPHDLDLTTLLPISWKDHHPYTNILWLAYIYQFLTEHFIASCSGRGEKKAREEELNVFKKETKELWMHLDPLAPRKVLSFPSAVDVVRFAVEAGWIEQEQLMEDGERSMLSFVDDSVCFGGGEGEEEEEEEEEGGDAHLRRSPRRGGNKA